MELLKEKILSQYPTEEQKDAIFSNEKEFILRSAPGSGKTWTASRRFIWRGSNWEHSAGGLALLSFTNTAVHEFVEAAKDVGRKDLITDPNFIGTFDSFVERFIIAPFGHLITAHKKRPCLLHVQQPSLNNKALKIWIDSGRRKYPVNAWEITPVFDGNKFYFYHRDKLLDASACTTVENLFKIGYYTHDQRLFFSLKLISEKPYLISLLSKRFPEIIVDEAQDTNNWLLALLDLLRGHGTKITLVGDPDQCIYEFNSANPEAMQNKQKDWNIPTLPLTKSFRCNSKIASAAKNISKNMSFAGRGDDKNTNCAAYIIRDDDNKNFSSSIQQFISKLNLCQIPMNDSAILCRGIAQLENIRGESIYNELQGTAKELASVCFNRDSNKNYKKSYDILEKCIRELTNNELFWNDFDENPNSDQNLKKRIAIWKYAKNRDLLPPLKLSANDWTQAVRSTLPNLITDLGLTLNGNLAQKIRTTGLDNNQKSLPLFDPNEEFPRMRQETIHKVKGETIKGVLVIGSSGFFDKVVTSTISDTKSEERRLAYVAMTRASNLLVLGLPSNHFDKYHSHWTAWGFITL